MLHEELARFTKAHAKKFYACPPLDFQTGMYPFFVPLTGLTMGGLPACFPPPAWSLRCLVPWLVSLLVPVTGPPDLPPLSPL